MYTARVKYVALALWPDAGLASIDASAQRKVSLRLLPIFPTKVVKGTSGATAVMCRLGRVQPPVMPRLTRALVETMAYSQEFSQVRRYIAADATFAAGPA